MKEVYQTLYGGGDSPPQERGDCYKACVASILELPMDEVPDYQEMPLEDAEAWRQAWKDWFADCGLYLMAFATEGYLPPESPPGYYIGHLKLPPHGIWHSVVCYNGEVVHDPMGPNRRYDPEDVEIYEVFCLIDPAKDKAGTE